MVSLWSNLPCLSSTSHLTSSPECRVYGEYILSVRVVGQARAGEDFQRTHESRQDRHVLWPISSFLFPLKGIITSYRHPLWFA